MHSSVAIVGVLIGVVILFFGRKLFWLCVAAVGFAVGVQIAPLLVNEASSLALVIALVFGGRQGPSEMEAPEATLAEGVEWKNPLSGETQITPRAAEQEREEEPKKAANGRR